MRQLQIFPNPSTPIAGAAAGAFIGSIAGSFVGALLSLTAVVKGAAGTLDAAEVSRRAAGLTNGFAAVGATIGAYIGAKPHQRIAAGVGALVGGGTRAVLWDAASPQDAASVMRRWYVSIPVGLLPTAGAALGAWGAGPGLAAAPPSVAW